MDNEGEHVVEKVQAVNWSCLFDSFHHSSRLSVRRYDGELLAAIASEPHTISESVNRELKKSQHKSNEGANPRENNRRLDIHVFAHLMLQMYPSMYPEAVKWFEHQVKEI